MPRRVAEGTTRRDLRRPHGVELRGIGAVGPRQCTHALSPSTHGAPRRRLLSHPHGMRQEDLQL